MWQFLLAAAVAGSGFFVRRLFNGDGGDSNADADPQQTRPRVRVVKSETPRVSIPKFECTDLNTEDQGSNVGEDSVFRFSSQGGVRSGGKRTRKSKGNAEGVKKRVEVQRLERRLSFCLKRRRTGKTASAKCGSRCSREFFGWGLGVGMMYIMSAGKAEFNRLNKNIDETTKVVQELKSELCKRKSSCNMQFSSSMHKVDANAKHIQPQHFKSTVGNRGPQDMKDPVLLVTDDGESPSSALTEEPAPEMLEMDQLEAELESELQKLPGCFIEGCGHDGKESSGVRETEVKRYYEPEGEASESYKFNGVSPSELDQKLCHFVIEQQESQIVKLESELHFSRSKLHEKETELKALKDCVKRLSEFSLSSVSDEEEAEAYVEQVGLNSKMSSVGTKRAIDYESCGYAR